MALCSPLRRLGGPHASARYFLGSFRLSSTFTTPPYVHVYDFGEWSYTSAETIQYRVPYGQDRRPPSEYLNCPYYRSLREEQYKELGAKREKINKLNKLKELTPKAYDAIESLYREIRAHKTKIDELGAEAGQWIFEQASRGTYFGAYFLRYLRGSEAAKIVKRLFDEAKGKDISQLTFIVGMGAQSTNTTRVSEVVHKIANNYGFKVVRDQSNLGRVFVLLKPDVFDRPWRHNGPDGFYGLYTAHFPSRGTNWAWFSGADYERIIYKAPGVFRTKEEMQAEARQIQYDYHLAIRGLYKGGRVVKTKKEFTKVNKLLL